MICNKLLNMKMSSNIMILGICCLAATVSGTEISLSGNVIDSKGSPVSGAAIFLKSDTSSKDLTGDSGEFNIGNGTNAKHISLIRGKRNTADLFDISGNRLNLVLGRGADFCNAEIYSVNGKMVYSLSAIRMSEGIHSYKLPSFAGGLYLMKLKIDKEVYNISLIGSGDGLVRTDIESAVKNADQISKSAASDTPDTLIVRKDGYADVQKVVTSYRQTGISIVMDLTKSVVKAVSDLPEIKEMPDPLTMNNGTKVTTADQWRTRRREMIQILEDYEYGHMPPPPGNVSAQIKTASTKVSAGSKLEANYRMLHLTFGPDGKCGFDIGIFTPVTEMPDSGYPILISLDYSAGTSSISSSTAALSRGYAVATIPYNQLGADAASWKTSAFFPSYPDYDWRDISAWAWGISRAIDYLVTDSLVDRSKIMATGASRLGQAVLLAGAFDERIALSAPVAGGMAFRFSGKEMGGGRGQGITEIVDQNTYWFGPLLPQFKNKTPKLPSDQHWLPALTAPRLFIMCNSYSDQYGRAYAALQSYQCALPVYKFLDVDENIGLNFREGSHGMTSEDWSALLDFADQKLLKKAGTRKFNTIPPADKTP